MRIKLGRLSFEWRSKSYEQLRQMIHREQGGDQLLKTSTKQQLEAYRSWVYSCVTLISDRVATLPYAFYNKATGEKLKSSNKGYAVFTKPFRQPNEMMSFRFIKQFCQIQLDLCGMAIIYPVRNFAGQVWELWPLNMTDFMRVEVGGNPLAPQVKYVFRAGNGWIDFTNQELIILQYANPLNPWLPMSPIMAQAYASDIDTFVEVYERDFFKNSARVDMALTTDSPIDQDKADEIKQRWKEKYTGTFHDVAVLDTGLKPVPIKFTNRDFEFLNLANWSMEKVLAAYRVPKAKLGFSDANRAGAVQSDIAFNRESIEPRLITWDEELTSMVCESFDERLQIKHDNPIPRDRTLDMQEAKIYLSGLPVLTINEWRQQNNLKPVTGGDVIIIPNKYVKLDDLDKITEAATRPKEPGGESSNTGSDGRPAADGSDDRDDSPTDGRSAGVSNQKTNLETTEKDESVVRTIWNQQLSAFVAGQNGVDLNALHEWVMRSMAETISVLFEIMKAGKPALDTQWISQISMDVAKRYQETLLSKWKNGGDWEVYVNKEFTNNVRLARITNSIIRSCVNYSKYEIIKGMNCEAVWAVNRNECGHNGRVKNIVNGGKDFRVGDHSFRFPGESLNLSCDCSINISQLSN